MGVDDLAQKCGELGAPWPFCPDGARADHPFFRLRTTYASAIDVLEATYANNYPDFHEYLSAYRKAKEKSADLTRADFVFDVSQEEETLF